MSQKEDLIVLIASKVHEDYCEDEYRDFFSRLNKIKKEGQITNPGDMLRQACFDGETKRNDVVLDMAWLQLNETIASSMFDEYDSFKKVIASGGIDLKDFAIRNLVEEEIIEMQRNGDYLIDTQEENILRPFSELSMDSKKENLAAALGAYKVYEQLSKAGVTIDEMEHNPEIKNLIGIAIHTDWLKRNRNHEDESIKIPFSELTEQAKEQDLTVFGALLHVVKKDLEKYRIAPEPNYQIPDYISQEKEVLSNKKSM